MYSHRSCIMLYLVLYFTVCFINSSVGNHVYYVIPTTGNQTCPTSTGQVCHNISYYATEFTFPSTVNITLIFLEGQHMLNYDLYILGDHNIALKGQGYDDHWSTVIYCCVRCTEICIETSAVIHMEGLTYINGSLVFPRQVQLFYIQSMSLQNVSLSVNTNYIIINDSILDNTNCMENWCDQLYLYLYRSGYIHNLTIQGVTDNKFNMITGTALSISHSAAVYILCSDTRTPIELTDVTIANNNATGIYIVECAVTFGNVTISNNHSPFYGGGMRIDGTSDISSIPNTTVSFINNRAKRVGGAIYIDSMGTYGNSFFAFYYNCFCLGDELKPIFINNSADSGGDNIYGGLFFECWPNLLCTFLNVINCSHDASDLAPSLNTNYPKPLSSYITGDPLGVCICNDSVDCTIRSLYKPMYPGQLITLSLVTVGQCGGISPGVLLTESNGVDIVLLTSDQQTLKTCKNFTYQIKQSNTTTSNERNIVISYKNVNHNLLSYQHSSLLINISFLPCPYGLETGQYSGVCECNDVIKDIANTQCNISLMPHPISRSSNNWLYYNHQYNCIVAYEHCPFDYCITSNVSLNLNESDLQCTYNRSGTLCGQCQSGLSLMLGSNQCGHCSNYYLFLLPLFIIAGIGLIFMLLTLNLTVSVGTINGLLFYANILKLNEPVLFPNISIPVLTQFISWLNLDFGFNVCFFNGLDGYWKTWLQFTFPLYIWLLIGGVIIGCHYSGKLSRLCGNNAVPVLATLILMSFTKLVRTVTNVLMVSTIKCEDFYWNVWSVDGNIEYLSGKHIPLFVISLLFLLTGLIYTVVIFCSQWLQQYGGKYCSSRFDPYVRLKPFIDSYTGPYEDKYRFWTGLLLIVRLIVTAVFAYTTGSLPQVNNYITVFVCLILLAFVRGKYRDTINTILEFFFLFNLSVTSLLNAVSSDIFGYNIKVYINGVSIGLSLVVFIGIVISHVYVLVRKKYTCIKKSNRHQQLNTDQEPLLQVLESSNEEEMYSPARMINRRESLIFDFELTY